MVSHNAFADTVTTTVPVNGAFGVATNPNTGMTYVANGNSYSIQVIRDSTNTVVANVTTSSTPSYNSGCYTYDVAVNQKTNFIYTNNGACVSSPPSSVPTRIPQSVSVINGINNQVIAVVNLSGDAIDSQPPQSITVNPTTNMVYAMAGRGSYVAVINGSTNQLTASINVPTNNSYNCSCSDITVNPQTNMIYVLGDNLITVINGTTNSIVNSFSWGKSSNNGISINPDTNRIYVSNSDNSVSVIDGLTDQVISNIPSISYGYVAVNPLTNKIYVSDVTGGNQIAVLDGQTNTLASQVQVGQNPFGIGIDTNTNKIY
ncbi:MAG: YncE family protein, partial [Nitrosotalea sp.]